MWVWWLDSAWDESVSGFFGERGKMAFVNRCAWLVRWCGGGKGRQGVALG
jgi:hypothetical protein